jgi:diguanylate cyclase (GGDEF)-like protein
MPISQPGSRISKNSLSERGSVRFTQGLAQLEQQTDQARTVLSRLDQDIRDAESRLGSGQGAALMEANDQLVLSALRAQGESDEAARELSGVPRSATLHALTSLPNRGLLVDRLARATASAKRHGTHFALLFLDVDNLELINDSLGHAKGDEVLQLTAHCLASSVRATDTVSRYGGDEFVVLLADVTEASAAVCVARKIQAALAKLTWFGDHGLPLTARIGMSIYPDHGGDVGTLVHRTDAAMYHAKTNSSVTMFSKPSWRRFREALSPH